MILITLLGEIALGYGLLGWLARRTSRHQQLARVVLLSYSVRVALGIVLYVVSLWKWPILRSLQVDHGFWSFGPDCGVYHYFGQQIADAWRKGIELPDTVFGFEYFALVAAVYRLLGPHPLFPIVVNCALAAGTGLLAYLISRRFLEERAAIVSAALVGFWPSTFIWSAQLLKDPLSWFLLFAALWLIVSLLPSRGAEGGRLLGMLVRWVLLSLVMILLTRARFYLGSALSLAALVVLLPAGCVACIQKASRRGIQCVSLVAVIVLSTLFARTLNVVKLLSPAKPEVAHYNLAILDWEKGELIEATREFYRALELRGDFQKAYLGVAAVQIQLANWESAIRAYEQYLEREAPEKRWPISQLISRLYSELGNDHFINRRVGQAIAAYEHAIALDPSQADILANLGLVLAKVRNFDRAFAMCAQALQQVTPGNEAKQINRVVALALLEKGDDELSRPNHGLEGAEAALPAYEHAILFDPAQAAAYLGLGHALDEMGLFDQALEAFRHAWELSSPGAEEHQVKQAIIKLFLNKGDEKLNGKSVLTLEDAKAAVAAYERALLFNPMQVEAFARIGHVMARLGRVEAATQAYERALYAAELGFRPELIRSIAQVCAHVGNCGLSKGDRAGALGVLGLASAPLEPSPAEAVLPTGGPPTGGPRGDLLLQPLQAAGSSAGGALLQPLQAAGSSAGGALHALDLSGAEAVLPTGGPRGDLPRVAAQLISANHHELLAMATRLFSSRAGRPEERLGRASRLFAEFLAQLDDQAIKMVSEPASGALGYRREGFVSAGGHALMDAQIEIKDFDSMTRYAPRALAIGFLAPFPWQWFDTHGSTGVMRLLAGMEMLLVYGLIPGILCGLWDALRWRRLEGLLLIACIVFTAIPISLVVANVGTLFRLRLLFLLPLLIVAAEGDPIGVYSRMWRWLAGLRRQGVRGIVKDDQSEISGVTSSPRKEVPVSALLDVIGQSEEGN